MTLMKKLRNGVLAAGLALAVAGFGGCRDKDDNPGDRANQPPKAQIGMDFGNGYDGNVNYLLTGTDADGTISNVYAKFNDGIWGPYSNGQAVSVPIVQGANQADIYAVDDFGAQSPVVSKSFTPATEAEARGKIEELLQQREYVLDPTFSWGTYSRDQIYGTGNGNIIADYLVTKRDGSRVVVEFIGENDNLQTELNDKSILDAVVVRNLYLKGLPISEIGSRFDIFAGNNNL